MGQSSNQKLQILLNYPKFKSGGRQLHCFKSTVKAGELLYHNIATSTMPMMFLMQTRCSLYCYLYIAIFFQLNQGQYTYIFQDKGLNAPISFSIYRTSWNSRRNSLTGQYHMYTKETLFTNTCHEPAFYTLSWSVQFVSNVHSDNYSHSAVLFLDLQSEICIFIMWHFLVLPVCPQGDVSTHIKSFS